MDKDILADSGAIDFESLVMREQRRVYLLCLRLLRNSDEAGSAAQDEFTQTAAAGDSCRRSTDRGCVSNIVKR
jgi:hypothetical protein